jgi:hypothetical protein
MKKHKRSPRDQKREYEGSMAEKLVLRQDDPESWRMLYEALERGRRESTILYEKLNTKRICDAIVSHPEALIRKT